MGKQALVLAVVYAIDVTHCTECQPERNIIMVGRSLRISQISLLGFTKQNCCSNVLPKQILR